MGTDADREVDLTVTGPERGLPFCEDCAEEYWTDDGSLYCPTCDARDAADKPTAERLRRVAAWLDTYDALAASYFDLLERDGLAVPEELVDVRAAASGKEVQSDLRRWADAIESA